MSAHFSWLGQAVQKAISSPTIFVRGPGQNRPSQPSLFSG